MLLTISEMCWLALAFTLGCRRSRLSELWSPSGQKTTREKEGRGGQGQEEVRWGAGGRLVEEGKYSAGLLSRVWQQLGRSRQHMLTFSFLPV